MPAITLGPIASGLPKDIVQKLLEAERQPVRQLEARKERLQSRLDLAGDLAARISDIQSDFQSLARQKQFLDLAAEVGRPELLEATVDKELASVGEYQLEVVQLAGRSSMLSNPLPDKDETQVGVGYFSYELPNGEEREVFVDENHSTLEGLAKLINQEPEMNLNAIVVDDGTGEYESWRLIVTHKESGEINDAEFPSFYLLDGDEDFYLDEERPAQNSKLKVNGFDVEFQGTTIDSLLPGVTMNLKEAAPGKEFTFKVIPDKTTIKGKILALVEKLNGVLGFIQEQNNINDKTDTSRTLGGDITLSNLEARIRQINFAQIRTSKGYRRLGDLGIVFQKDGLLSVDEKKLEAKLDAEINAIAEMFTGSKSPGPGLIELLGDAVRGYTQAGGIMPSRQAGIRRRIRDVDNQIENKERYLAQRERALKEKFSRLESTMAQLKTQQGQVQQALGTTNVLGQLNFNTAK